MKSLTRSLLMYVLIYGTKDKDRFHRHAMSMLEGYSIDEARKNEIVDFSYDFFRDVGERMGQVDVISRGVRSGSRDLESKLEAILNKLDEFQNRSKEGE